MVSKENSAVKRKSLLLGGYFSLTFSLFQLSGRFWPPDAIRYFGGPAELRVMQPVLYTFVCIIVAVIVAVLGLYALSGAGRIRPLPLLRTIITATASIYILRGLLLIPQIPAVIKHPSLVRFLLFSVISLCVGLAHLAALPSLFKRVIPDQSL
jgi:putative oxidoreductase